MTKRISRWTLTTLSFVAAVTVVSGQSPQGTTAPPSKATSTPTSSSQAQDQAIFRATANYVYSDVRVVDAKGQFVPNLGPDDFKIYEDGVEHARRWENAQTIASGIRVPQAIGDFLILRAVRESGGFAIAVSDEAISEALDEVAREEGFLMCPEGAATYAAYTQSLADGRIKRSDQVVLFNCATGLKYPLPPIRRTLDRHAPIDFSQF